MINSESPKTAPSFWKIVVPVSVVVIGLWLLWPWVVEEAWLGWHDYERRGQFGDMFGALNTLFSGLAFSILIAALYLQGQELKAQREELRIIRKEYEKTTNEMSQQTVIMDQQQTLQEEHLALLKFERLAAEERQRHEVEPKLEVIDSSHRSSRVLLIAHNAGGPIRSIKAIDWGGPGKFPEPAIVTESKRPIWGRGEKVEIGFLQSDPHFPHGEYWVKITYLNQIDEKGEVTLRGIWDKA